MLQDLVITTNHSDVKVPLKDKGDTLSVLAPFYRENKSSRPDKIYLDTASFSVICDEIGKATRFYLLKNEIITHIISTI